jgi:MFS family permease
MTSNLKGKVRDFSKFQIGNVNALRNIMLVVNPLIWYSAIIFFLQNTFSQLSSNGTLTGNNEILVWCLHFLGIISAALVGSFLTKKFDKNRFLISWMALGTISSITLFAISPTTSIASLGLIVFLLGVSLGIGMPACMEYYTDNIGIEKRGRTSGIVMLLSGIGVFVMYLIWPISAIALGIILALWRLTSILIFYSSKELKITNLSKSEFPSFKRVISQQSFILYFIPWVMFSLVNYFSGSVQIHILGTSTFTAVSTIQSIMIAIFAAIGGFLLDSVGRKRIAISGFILLGVDYATLGLYPTNTLANYFSASIDGVAWGFLLVLFVVTIWGDLSQNTKSAKYYAIGVSPFFISKLLEVTVGGSLANFVLSVAGQNGLFSFLAFFLFVAVLPLIYAPETLPEKIMKDRELKGYVEKALKQAQKETGKNQRKDSAKTEKGKKTGKEEPEEPPGYEEARKLAEKYY